MVSWPRRQSEILIGAIMRSIAVFLLAATAIFGADKWTRVRTANFDVVSDAGAAPARQVLRSFATARRIFRDAPGSATEMPPVRVFVFRSERNYAPFRMGPSVQAFFQSGPDHDWVVIRDAGPETERIALHEYVHSLLNRSAVRLPGWLEEGTAELYSTMRIEKHKIIIGSNIASHLQVLRDAKWLTAAELSGAAKTSPYYNEFSRAGIFYGESWALVHMLNLSPGYHAAMPSYIQALADGMPPASAFRSAFGKSLDDAIADLQSYVAIGLRVAEVGAPPADETEAGEPETVGEPEALADRAELLLLMKRDEQAAAIFKDLAKRFPRSPATPAGLAILALRDRRYSEARELFRKAIELGTREPGIYLEYAMLLRDTGGSADQIDAMLKKAVELSPNYAEAHFLLGVRAGEAGDLPGAIAHLRRATEILPLQSLFWQELAQDFLKLHKNYDARTAARRALQLSATPQEEGMARALLESIE
jgi:tetratricopeptide (TPR) repeat protein